MGLVQKELVSVDWDDRTLRVVHAAARGKSDLRIRKVLSAVIPRAVVVGDATSFGEFLRDVLAREGVGARRLVLNVPRDQAVLNTLQFPLVPVDELPAMVEFQITKELPFPLSEAVTDFVVAGPAEEGGRQDVLVAAIRREVLEHYVQVAEAAELRLERVGLRPYAHMAAIYELLGSQRHEQVLFVDVGPSLTEIDVLHDGRLAFSRAASVVVPERRSAEEAPEEDPEEGRPGVMVDLDRNITVTRGEAVVPEARQVVRDLLREVVMTLEAYRSAAKASSLVGHVVVGGDCGVEAELLEALQERFGVGGELYNPTASFGWDSESGRAACGFAAALGSVLEHTFDEQRDFDFIHPKRSEPLGRRRLKKAPIVAAVVLLFVGAGAVAYTKIVGPKREALARLEDEVNHAKTELKEYKRFDEMIKKVEQFEGEQVIWLDELANLLSVWPGHEQMVFSQINLSQKERRIQLKMECKERTVADETVALLDEFQAPGETGPHFDATLETTTDKRGDYTVRGAITIKLVGSHPAE